MEKYESEVLNRWGDSDEYLEHKQKTKNYTKEKWNEINEGLFAIFAEFAEAKSKGLLPSSLEVSEIVLKLKAYISDNYYNCKNEVLLGLGKMYIADERFKGNIDKWGEGTAEFASQAIDYYCRGK